MGVCDCVYGHSEFIFIIYYLVSNVHLVICLDLHQSTGFHASCDLMSKSYIV
uniref:Uncharacterized protein n=1 Tax=Octopus bimaculoides TaxID=37653 RepID=A0A0L8GZG9_OCTBM